MGNRTISSNEKYLATFSYFWIMVLPVILFAKSSGKYSDFVKSHTRQALVLFVFSAVVFFLLQVMGTVSFLVWVGQLEKETGSAFGPVSSGIPLHVTLVGWVASFTFWVLGLLLLLAMVVGMFKALRGQKIRIPIVAFIADKIPG